MKKLRAGKSVNLQLRDRLSNQKALVRQTERELEFLDPKSLAALTRRDELQGFLSRQKTLRKAAARRVVLGDERMRRILKRIGEPCLDCGRRKSGPVRDGEYFIK